MCNEMRLFHILLFCFKINKKVVIGIKITLHCHVSNLVEGFCCLFCR